VIEIPGFRSGIGAAFATYPHYRSHLKIPWLLLLDLHDGFECSTDKSIREHDNRGILDALCGLRYPPVHHLPFLLSPPHYVSLTHIRLPSSSSVYPLLHVNTIVNLYSPYAIPS